MAFELGTDTGAVPTADVSWWDKIKGLGADANTSLQKDPGMWSTLLGQLAGVVAPENQLVKGAGAIGAQFGKARTLMDANKLKVNKEDEFKQSVLKALTAGYTDAGKTGLNKVSYKADGQGGRVADISLDLEDSPGIDPTTGQPMQTAEAGNINANVPGSISLDQGPIAAPGTDQITRKGFDIRPFFQP